MIKYYPTVPKSSNKMQQEDTLRRNEFYTTEHFTSREDFIGKSFCYQLYFNSFRKNGYKNEQTPNNILQKINTNRHNPRVAVLPPIILDPLIKNFLPGYHVRKADNIY